MVLSLEWLALTACYAKQMNNINNTWVVTCVQRMCGAEIPFLLDAPVMKCPNTNCLMQKHIGNSPYITMDKVKHNCLFIYCTVSSLTTDECVSLQAFLYASVS